MHDSHLDTVLRSLATSSRRGILAVVAGALLAGRDRDAIFATRKPGKRGKDGKRRTTCKEGPSRNHGSQQRIAAEKRKRKRKKRARPTAPAPIAAPDLCAGVTCGAVPNGSSGCVGGTCLITSCEAGFQDCSGGLADGCETNVRDDAQHCGACRRGCPGQGEANTTVRCAGGKCEQVRTISVVGTASFTAPAAGTVTVEAIGAEGGRGGRGGTIGSGTFTKTGGPGGFGGLGGRVTASFAVAAGEVLQITVGRRGDTATNGGTTSSGIGGTGGSPDGATGGAGLVAGGPGGGGGGGGGGSSDIRRAPFAAADRIVAAFGGGGGGGGSAGDPTTLSGASGGAGGNGGAGGGGTSGGPGAPTNNGDGDGVSGRPGSHGSGFGPTGGEVTAGYQIGNGRVTMTFVES
jgi:hypothetical protein